MTEQNSSICFKMKLTECDPILEQSIMVIGAARSETTVLGNMLGAHPEMALLIEKIHTVLERSG